MFGKLNWVVAFFASVALLVLLVAVREYKQMTAPKGDVKEVRVIINASTGKIVEGNFPSEQELKSELNELYERRTGYRIIVKYPQDPENNYKESIVEYEIAAMKDKYGVDRQEQINKQIAGYSDFVRKSTKPKSQIRYIFWFFDVTHEKSKDHSTLARSVFPVDELLARLRKTGDGAEIILCRITGDLSAPAMRISIPKGEADQKREELVTGLHWLTAGPYGSSTSVIYDAIDNTVWQGLRMGTEEAVNPYAPVEIIGVGDTVENSGYLTDTTLYGQDGKLTPEKAQELDQKIGKIAPAPKLGPNSTLTWIAPPVSKDEEKIVLFSMQYMRHRAELMGISDPKKIDVQFGSIQ
jgi:hypothetical protein